MVRNIDGQAQFGLSSLPSQLKSGSTSPSPQKLLGNNKLLTDVEKHLDDVKKGKGYLSKEVNGKVRQKQALSSSELASINPSLSTLYNGVSSGLSYAKNARFVTGVSQSIETFKRLVDIYG
ncbi:MAG: hypothetical protein KDD70_09525 [Bdellovibrionales bacterium]|nr:hypothetical protein [Bdellovibrionales bacterium]